MLQILDVHKHYDHPAGKVQVLRGIDLNITSGDVVAIVGPSGAGKSTLLHIMGGLDRPAQGQVQFEDEDIYRLHENKRAQIRNQKFGFIFQFYHLLPEFTALENVILPALVDKNASLDAVKTKAIRLLDKVGLSQRYEHKPHELSGGEQQRVAIARALINEPKVIFCDEPTGNLDSESGKGVIDLLMDLNKNNKQTLVIVTHDDAIAKRSHRVVPMRDGKLQ
jgi:lipoprotein-releasing system ATP-binding protein